MKKKADEFIPTRQSLLDRLKDWGDDDSWRDFLNTYRSLIHATALKSGLTEQEAQDVVQETALSVAKTIKEFKYDPGRCSFKSWLRHLTQRRIADCFRKRPRERLMNPPPGDESSDTPLIDRVADPNSLEMEAIWEEEWQKQLLAAAIEKVKTRVSAEQFQIFDLYVLKKMPVRKVTAALGTSIGQVYLAKHRISRLIKEEVKVLRTEMG